MDFFLKIEHFIEIGYGYNGAKVKRNSAIEKLMLTS